MSGTVTLVITVAIVFLTLSTFITLFVIIYQRRQLNFKKTTEQLKESFQQTMLQAQLEMQEHTFNTISSEIHDNVGQVLSLAKVQLNIIDQADTLDKNLLADAKESVSKAMTDLRDIAKSLNSERVELSSLVEICGQELQRINRSGIMLTSLVVEGKEQKIEKQKKLIVFRIIQEVLQNILKHSKAKNIKVTFHYKETNIEIDIADDGIGFNKEVIAKNEGLGVQNIINRARLIGGDAHINSIINRGTTVKIISPYE